MVQEIGALLLFLMLKANVLLSFDKQEEKATLVGYIDSAGVLEIGVDVLGGGVGVGVDVLDIEVGVDVSLPVSIGLDGGRVAARVGTAVF